jgi:hypothetical protein
LGILGVSGAAKGQGAMIHFNLIGVIALVAVAMCWTFAVVLRVTRHLVCKTRTLGLIDANIGE